MNAHEIRNGGIGHGWFVVSEKTPGYYVTVAGPYTTRAQAEAEAERRDAAASSAAE